MKRFSVWVAGALCALAAGAQEPVVLNGFWDNWYVQAGLDMSLQKPYKFDFAKVFPNGKTFGVDVALGKWYTPVVGLRAKLNWENGIGLFRNDHANWLAPFDEPGVNMDRGGYVCGVGDVMVDLHNLFAGYDPQRLWNAQVYIRGGGLYNFGVPKGSPLLGAGIGSTFRINDSWSAYVDGAINLVSSGHTGQYTGVGTGANAFFDFNVGVQYNIGHKGWKKATPDTQEPTTHGFWSDWFWEAGIDMALQKPYGKRFSEVFPKGDSFGIDLGIGKWFSPFIALRAHLNWENGLINNKKLEWLASNDDGKSNHDCGGFIMGTLDVPVSVTNIVMGYDEAREYNGYVYARAGLAHNLALSSTNPIIGGGIGYSHALNDRYSAFGEFGMQTTTSDFYNGVSSTGLEAPKGFNCFFTVEVGVRWRIR